MHERFEKRIEEGLVKITASCGKRRQKSGAVERRVGRLLERNTRAARLFNAQVEVDDQASRNYAGRRWKVGGNGRAGVKAATCCAAT
jgi:hypothetical protein